MEEIIILGEQVQTGAYLLRLKVAEDLRLRFGRFQHGRLISVTRGDYVYVGSAMAHRGSMSLGRRLLRHATRQDAQRPQVIRPQLLAALTAAGLGPGNLQAPGQKKLFWNVDYLLEENTVFLSQVIILRCRANLEDDLAHYFMGLSGSRVLANGLGANDKRSQTHLLAVDQTAAWWQQLPAKLSFFAGGSSKPTT